MTPAQREQYVISHEGNVLTVAGTHGVELGGSFARCMADGAVNALVRMEGAEAAALYAFALSDRIVGGVRTPTPVVPLAAKPADLTPAEDIRALFADVVAKAIARHGESPLAVEHLLVGFLAAAEDLTSRFPAAAVVGRALRHSLTGSGGPA